MQVSYEVIEKGRNYSKNSKTFGSKITTIRKFQLFPNNLPLILDNLGLCSPAELFVVFWLLSFFFVKLGFFLSDGFLLTLVSLVASVPPLLSSILLKWPFVCISLDGDFERRCCCCVLLPSTGNELNNLFSFFDSLIALTNTFFSSPVLCARENATVHNTFYEIIYKKYTRRALTTSQWNISLTFSWLLFFISPLTESKKSYFFQVFPNL